MADTNESYGDGLDEMQAELDRLSFVEDDYWALVNYAEQVIQTSPDEDWPEMQRLANWLNARGEER